MGKVSRRNGGRAAPHLIAEPDLEAASARCAPGWRRSGDSSPRAARGGARGAVCRWVDPHRTLELLGPLVADWRGAHLWFCDERCVAPDDEQSNARMALQALDAPGCDVAPDAGGAGPQAGAAAYERELADVVLDLALLGIGGDGHPPRCSPATPRWRRTGAWSASPGAQAAAPSASP